MRPDKSVNFQIVLKNAEREIKYLKKQNIELQKQTRKLETENLKCRKEYKQLFDLSPLGIAVYDVSGNYLYVNPAYCRIFLRKKNELIGKNYIQLIVPQENQGKEIETFVRLIKNKTGIKPYNAQNIRGDRKRIVVHYLGDYTRDIKEKITGIVIFCEDITKTLEMEGQLRQTEKMQIVGKLARGIAHDFNNHLAIISGYAGLLERELSIKPELLKYLDIIIESVDTASDLTDKFLAFARKGRNISVNINVNKILEDIINLLGHGIDKSIKIKKDLVSTTLFAVGDSSQLQNMLLTFTLNLCELMQDGEEIFFKTELTALEDEYCKAFKTQPGKYLKICILGISIKKEVLAHIFEPFLTNKKFVIGLPFVNKIVENHKEIIKIDSEINKGTECIIYLPLSKKEIQKKPTIAKYIRKDLKGAHIMIVDDEKLVCNMLMNVLTQANYKVSAFQDGARAIEEYKKSYKKIDLAILDMVMPGKNGKEVFAALKKINPEIKAVLSSGYSIDGQIQEILDMGILEFLHKPYKKDDLLNRIADILTVIS